MNDLHQNNVKEVDEFSNYKPFSLGATIVECPDCIKMIGFA